MGWIRGLIIIALMATHTSSGGSGVIAVVAGCTIISDGSMRPIQYIKVVVIGKRGWIPVRCCSVA